MIRVLIVDDQEMIRTGLRTIVDAHPDLEVVGETGDALAAIRELDAMAPDVVLMDIRMPGIDGVEATRRIRRSYPPEKLRILVLTTFDQDEFVLAAVRAGADGFFSKGASPAELTAGIVRVAGGGRALSATAVDALVDHVAEDKGAPSDPAVAARFEALTPRELEIVRAIVTGLDNTQIAADLYLSPLTVKTHANRAMMKVGARDRAQLVSFAVLAGIHP
ncbi:response regulator transcription factor [Propionicicella superfundia]|uniref:response regulator transcription factor n=1 Tax=Propionicicella superfundia TaxID=348582 RepID=UPI00041473A9|nr:response regulator transcription factor [Propionicicella superfundia]